jgi:hypothetical protein
MAIHCRAVKNSLRGTLPIDTIEDRLGEIFCDINHKPRLKMNNWNFSPCKYFLGPSDRLESKLSLL